jgi:hypothetical protein
MFNFPNVDVIRCQSVAVPHLFLSSHHYLWLLAPTLLLLHESFHGLSLLQYALAWGFIFHQILPSNITLGAKTDTYENHMHQTHMVRICVDCGTKVSITFVVPLFLGVTSYE